MRGESRWDEVEPELAKSWQERRGHSALDWAKARLATRDAWERLEGREKLLVEQSIRYALGDDDPGREQ